MGPYEVHSMGVRHVSREGEGGELRVSSHRRDPSLPLGALREDLRHKLWLNVRFDGQTGHGVAPSLGHNEGPRGLPEWPSHEHSVWETTRIQVDGTPLEVSVLSVGERWVGIGHLADVDVVLEAHRFPVEALSLVRLTDLSPYGVST